MTLDATGIATPIGPLSIIVHRDVVVAAGFTDDLEALHHRLPEPHRIAAVRRHNRIGPITDAVQAYLSGVPGAFDALPVAQPGGPFLQDAWAALRGVPAGETVTYTELAARAGRPAAVRAAAMACARNLVAPMVPCHRVIRRDGSLGGYYWGLPVKRWLLTHETPR